MAHHILHTDVIPGTVHLIDLAGTLNVRHEQGGEKDIVLLPQPTTEYDDPLNWVKKRKLQCALVLLLAVFSADVMTTLLSAALLDMSADTGIPLATLNSGVGVQYLFFGWSNLLWQPMGLTFGRRPTILLGAIEASGSGCTAGILFGIPFLGAVPAGFIATNLGWQWIQFIASIISAPCLIAMFFLLEETMFYRPPVQDEAVKIDQVEPEADKASNESPNAEKKLMSTSPPQTETLSGAVISRKTFIQKLKFWGARRPGQPHNFLRSVWLPLTLVRFPVFAFAGVLVGSVLSWFNVVNATIALVLAAEPYNFSTNMIGIMFLAPFIGCTIGCIFAGVSANRFAVWMARRRGGIFEPEYRLWMAVVPVLLHPAGCILFGVGAAHGVHWMGIAFGLAFIVGTFPIGSAIAINYIIDSYKEISGDGLVTMICIRNSMGFAFSYGVTPWIDATGVQNTYIAVGMIGMFLWSLSFLFIVIGKKTRKATARSYWALVEKHGLVAH